VAGYALKLALTRETYAPGAKELAQDMLWAAIATLYTLFMLWAGGLKHLLLACILFAPGAVLFFIARREKGQPVFTAAEKGIFAVVAAGALFGIYALVSGQIAI